MAELIPDLVAITGTDGLAPTSAGDDREFTVAARQQWRTIVRRFVRHRLAVASLVVGALAGYFRGIVDSLLMRFTDLALMIPLLIVVGVVSAGVPSAPWYVVPLLLGLFAWPLMARLTRAEFLSLREKEFVEAAIAIGSPRRHIIFKHILPNLAGPIIVNATLTVAGAILVETALSFLGLGIREPEVSLGLLINTYQNAFNTRPWLFWFPSMAIVLISLCVNFVGDGLRDAFDPRQTRVKA